MLTLYQGMETALEGGSMEKVESCEVVCIHEEIVEKVRGELPSEELLAEMADLFKIFSDSTRIRILSALEHAEMCVCDISALLSMTQSAISHQLRVLKQANLVGNRRKGRIVYYHLKDDHVRSIFDQAFEHIQED